MHSSLVPFSLVALLSTIPHTSAAPTKRQFGGRYGSGGPGRPGSRPQAWTPPWISPGSNLQQWDSPPAPVASIPDPTYDTASNLPIATTPTTQQFVPTDNDILTIASTTTTETSSQSAENTVSIETETVVASIETQQILPTSSSETETFLPGQTTIPVTSTTADSTNDAGVTQTFTPGFVVSSSTTSEEFITASGSTTEHVTTTISATSSSATTESSSIVTFLSSTFTTSTTTLPPFVNTTSSTISATTSSVIVSSALSTSATVSESSTSVTASSSTSTASTTSTPSDPNMLNGTFPDNSPPSSPPQATPGLNVDLMNTFSGSDSVSVYITAIDPSGRVMFLTPSQTWFYPTASSSTIPEAVDAALITIPLGSAGSTTTINLPGYFSSGRIYFSQSGSLAFFTLLNPQSGVTIVNPNPLNPTDASYNTDWAFVEMTYTSDAGLFANLSFVDFIARLPLGMQLTLTSGSVQTVQGTSSDSVDNMCAKLAAQTAADGQPWDQLCQRGSSSSSATGESSSPSFLRANSPAKYIAAVDSSAFRTYWDAYITAVWQKYASEDLLIDTQRADLGVVRCSTASGNLLCPSSSRPLPEPVSSSSLFDPSPALDIFACSGIFSTLQTDNALTLAMLPRVCAAINRSTLLLSEGGTTTPSTATPPSSYYPEGVPTNYYAKFAHEVQRDGKGYAFAYDDVAPSLDGGADVSGTVAGRDVRASGGWRVWVGGMPS